MKKTDIYTIPGNKVNLENLKVLVREKRLVPFIGAGFSMPACPGWGDFLKGFYKAIKEDGFLKTGDVKTYKELSRSLVNPYERLADWLIQISQVTRFKEQLKNTFNKSILPEMNGKYSLLHRVFKGLKITTNFDCFIEESSPVGSHVEVSRGNQKEDLQRLMVNYKQNSLLKIHGDLRAPNTIILSSAQYKQVYGDEKEFSPDALLPQFMEEVCTIFSLLFIGCSLMEDRTLMVMEKITEKQPHYTVVMMPKNKNNKADTLRRLSKYGIKPIWVSDWSQVEDVLSILANEVEPSKKEFVEIKSVTFDHGVTFVGREKELTQIEKNLIPCQKKGSVQVITGRFFSIDGAGGVGKTTLALEAAKRIQRRGVFKDYVLPPIRVDEHSPISYAMHLAGLLKVTTEEPKDKDAAQALVTALLKDRHLLLVLDNAAKWETLQYMLPTQSRSVILVTSRNRELYDHLRLKFRALEIYRINLEKFTKQEALELFREMLGEKYDEHEESIYLDISANLGYLPLALRQAIALMLFGSHDSAINLKEKLLNEDRLQLLRKGAAELDSDSRIVETVFDLSDELLLPQLLETLQILAICAPGPIPLVFLEKLASQVNIPDLETRLERLYTYSWCERRENRGQRAYELHQLVRELVQRRLGTVYRDEFISLVHKTFIDKEIHYRYKEQLISQLEEAFLWMKKSKDKRLKNNWLYDLFEFCRYRGYVDFYLRLTYAVEELFLEDKRALSVVYGHQAVILRRWGQLDDSMKLLKKQEELCEQLEDYAGLSRSYGNQALILQIQGKLRMAVEFHKKEEKICELLGDQTGLAISYGNQALILKAWGQMEESLSLLKKQEKICELLGDQAGLAISYGNQAIICKSRGQFQDAMELHIKEEIICKSLGDQVGLANTWWNQGLIHNAKGDKKKQAELWQKAVEVWKAMGHVNKILEKSLLDLLYEIKNRPMLSWEVSEDE